MIKLKLGIFDVINFIKYNVVLLIEIHHLVHLVGLLLIQS